MPTTGFLWDSSVNEATRSAVEPIVPLFEYLTHLGDGAVLLVLGVLIYWFGARGNRRDRLFVISVGVAALALSAGIKGVVELARPELAFAPSGYPGYSFPSAHAMGAAAFYGALAVSMEWGTRWRRYLLAGAVIAIVAISRVVMGLHFAGDVLVGVVLGLGLVGVGVWTRNEGLFRPGPMFLLAIAITALAAVLGSSVFLSLTLGASIGGFVGWHYIEGRPTTRSGAAVLVLGVVGVAGIVVLRLVSIWLGLGAPAGSPRPLVFTFEVAGYATLTALVLLLPWIAIRVEDRPIVRRLQSALPFRNRTIDVDRAYSDD